MILNLIGFVLSSTGGFLIILETISGSYIRPKIYCSILKGVHEFDMEHHIKKIKLRSEEIRFLIWIILVFLGFILQIVSFLYELFKQDLLFK